MLWEFEINLNPKSSVAFITRPNLTLAFCLFFICVFMILLLPDVGILLCR